MGLGWGLGSSRFRGFYYRPEGKNEEIEREMESVTRFLLDLLPLEATMG